MSEEQMNDSKFGRLFIIMIIAMTVLTAIIMVLASMAATDVNARLDERSDIENTSSVADRLAPVGEFATETAAPRAPVVVADLTGADAYASCAACHGAGIAGAPAVGDTASWSSRIAQGIDVLYDHAINGYQGDAGMMPAKGGNTSLSDQTVKNAVDHMIELSK